MPTNEENLYWQEWLSEEYSPAPRGSENSAGEFWGTATGFEQRVLKLMLNTIEKGYGVKINVEPQNGSAHYSVDFREALLAAAKLKVAGVVEKIEKNRVLTDEPKVFSYRAAVRGTKASGQNGVGVSFASDAEALWPALGEAVDRYSLIHFRPQKYLDAPFRSVSSGAIDIFSLAGISPQRRLAGHPKYKLQFDAETIFRWVEGYSLTRGHKTLIPLQLVTFYHWPREREPFLRPPISTGSAAGKTLSQALCRGILEVIERDAFMITWVKKLSPIRLDLSASQDVQIQKIVEQFARYHLGLDIMVLPTDAPCHVTMAVVVDNIPQHPHLTVGLRASLNLKEAILTSIQEALTTRFFARSFLPSAAANLPDITEVDKIDRLERIGIWATRPELKRQVQFLWEGTLMAPSELTSFPQFGATIEQLAFLVDHFKKQNTEVVYVKNLPLEVRGEIPFTSVYVLVPEYQPMHLHEALPYFYGRRLEEVPLRLGYDDRHSVLNTIPHPFP